MKYFRVTYDVGDGIFSANIICANTGQEEREAVTETAQRYAEAHGYGLCGVTEITECEAQSNFAKGMPVGMIDEEAERAHDPSFMEV